MYKILILLKRKAGTTREEFKAHYEQHHVPMGVRILRGNVKYQRRYLSETYLSNPLSESPIEGEFDAVTEIWCRDREAWLATRKLIAEAAVEVSDDRKQYIERSQMYFIEEELESPIT